MSEIKAELVWISPHSQGTYHERAGCCEMEPVCVPHYIIPAAGVPDDDYMQVLMDRFGRNNKTASMEIAFARHVLDAMGLKEVK